MSAALVVMEDNRALAPLDKARQMLAECRDLSEVKKIRGLAESYKMYAKAENLGREAQNYAAEISFLAARKAGEILKQLQRDTRQEAGAKKAAASVAPPSEYSKTLKDTGTKHRTARHWQKLAEIPQPTFENYVSAAKEKQQDITAAGLLKSLPKPAPAAPKKPAVLTPTEKRVQELEAFAHEHFSRDGHARDCRRLPNDGLFELTLDALTAEEFRAAVLGAFNCRQQQTRDALERKVSR